MVRCDRCLKWRELDPTTDPDDLPEAWYCELGNYGPRRSCEDPEDPLVRGKALRRLDA